MDVTNKEKFIERVDELTAYLKDLNATFEKFFDLFAAVKKMHDEMHDEMDDESN